MHPKDADGIANSIDCDQTAPLGTIMVLQSSRLLLQMDNFEILAPIKANEFSVHHHMPA